MKTVQNKNLQTTYFLSFFLYNLARVLPHAILTVILLGKGMTIGNIAIIQSFFMIAGIIFEFPSGILTDFWSEKKMYLLSLGLLGMSYIVIAETDNFFLLCLSWFIYGISSASMSGSLETFFLRKYEGNEGQIKKFNVKFNNTNLYSTLIGGGIGSFVYQYIGIGIYWISIIIVLFAALMIIFFFKEDSTYEKEKMTISNIYNDFKKIKNTRLMKYIILMAIFQIILQLFFQFWQVMFLNNSIKKEYFGIVYVIFQVVAILANYIFKKIDLNRFRYILVFLVGMFLTLTVYASNKYIFLVTVFLFLIPFNLYNNQLIIDIQKCSPSNLFASIVSLSGTISSIVSMLFLWGVGILDNYIDFNKITVISAIVFVVASLLVAVFNKKKKAY